MSNDTKAIKDLHRSCFGKRECYNFTMLRELRDIISELYVDTNRVTNEDIDDTRARNCGQ